jgi:hypothetical protein
MLDIMPFGAFKKHALDLGARDEEQLAAAIIITVYYDFKQGMMEINIWGTF